MPYVAVLHEDAPIVMVRITGKMTGQVHFEVSRVVANLIEHVPGRIYRINDLTGVELGLVDMLDIISQMAKGWAGTASDPRVHSLFVADNPNFTLGLTYAARKWGWPKQIHVFARLADALAYTHEVIEAAMGVSTQLRI